MEQQVAAGLWLSAAIVGDSGLAQIHPGKGTGKEMATLGPQRGFWIHSVGRVISPISFIALHSIMLLYLFPQLKLLTSLYPIWNKTLALDDMKESYPSDSTKQSWGSWLDQALATNITGTEYCLRLTGTTDLAFTGGDMGLSYDMRYTLLGRLICFNLNYRDPRLLSS